MALVSNIIGHENQMEQLQRDIDKSSLSHAYLFTGKKHLGKFTTALWFIQELLCKNLKGNERQSVIEHIRKKTHPDLLIVDRLWVEGVCTDWNIIAKSSTIPQEHRAKTKVKTDTIGIDDIRALQERLYETPQGSHTCCLIRSIERLHNTAANALLKILEEPPPHVLFCLTTESLSSVPATIISRMRILHFSPVPNSKLEPFVRDLSEEDHTILLGIAQGSPGIILECMYDAERLREERQARINARSFLDGRSMLNRMKLIQEAIEKEGRTSPFLRQLFIALREKLHSQNPKQVIEAEEQLQKLFLFLYTLQSNTNKQLLSAHVSFQFSSQ